MKATSVISITTQFTNPKPLVLLHPTFATGCESKPEQTMKSFTKNYLLFIAVCLLSTSLSWAGLSDYKQTKHEKTDKVEDCEKEYFNQCSLSCKDKECKETCKEKAPDFCKERSDKKFRQQVGLAAKGLSVGAGLIAILMDDPMDTLTADTSGSGASISPYTIIWNRFSMVLETNGALLQDDTRSAGISMLVKKGILGLSGSADYLWEGDEYLWEADLGPSFFLGSANFIFGLQPSILLSSGNHVDTEWGAGVRSQTSFVMGQSSLYFNPLLGYINEKWQYQLKVGFNYRLTPKFGLAGGYEYRDIVNLNDLDISTASIQGAHLKLSYRINY
jgi:hypothetical protein